MQRRDLHFCNAGQKSKRNSDNKGPNKGNCCICCEEPVDSLLYRYLYVDISLTALSRERQAKYNRNKYIELIMSIILFMVFRCGHMCTCFKCAHDLLRGTGKCPICRDPIMDVVRAYAHS